MNDVTKEDMIQDKEEQIVQEESMPIDSEKHAKFMEESKERMSKICTQIAYLEKIAGKRSVDYTQENVEKMFSYLENHLSKCKETFMARFENSDDSQKFDFDF
ncbi:MAG: hypothetical protein Q4D37_09215 [Oscillospiraceae bacterium]|nr:hypothetical protein [Oscillospiraceae bacterium]